MPYVCRCLTERKPVIWLYQKVYHPFIDEGVYALPTNFQPDSFPRSYSRWHSSFRYICHISSENGMVTIGDDRTVIVMNPRTKEIHQA